MKKVVILLLFIMFLFPIYSSEYLLSTLKCWTFNSYSSRMYPAEAEIKYETDFAKGYLIKYGRTYFTLDDDALKNLRNVCDKYFEWEEIAVKNNAEIQKEIPIRIKVSAIWTTYSDDACLGIGELYFTFFSQSPTHHQLVISSTKIDDILSDYRDTTLENLYFNKNEVEALKQAISEENLKSNLDKVKQKQDVESLFN